MDEEELKRLQAQERLRKSQKPSIKGFFLTILWYGGLALAGFLILGFLTDGYGTGSGGDIPGKECFNYEKANGDWANSCDQ